MTLPEPPYLRIAAELRRRIDGRELHPGDLLPSTREIVRAYGVAMATATKALAVLQRDGLARAVPGVGTVVDIAGNPAHPPHDRRRTPKAHLNRDCIISAALNVADDEGLTALSMRRLAADLGVTTMALYRYVSSRDHLILLMADAAFGEFSLPEPPPPGWRDQLETAARLQWSMYRRHPWLAQITSFTRPLLTPQAMAHSEWVMRAMDGLDFSPATAIHVHVTLAAYVRGLAVNLEPESDATARSGINEEGWMDAHGTPALTRIASGQPAFPHLALIPPRSLNLDTLFDFGLQRLLDGIAVMPGTTRTTMGFSSKL